MIYQGDCIEVMRAMPDASVDSIVTDPPYGLGFMGRKWDIGVPAVEVFVECLRVLKPGGHLLAFGGTRTSHRLVCAIEDAGFEIRDTIAWLYGSGFPKSQNVSKAIDKQAGAEREVLGVSPNWRESKRDREKDGGMEVRGENAGLLTGPPVTEAAAQWEGWGTALKPAMEPICVARKPLAGTVAANVQAHGTGAVNVDGCRVGADGGTKAPNFGETAGMMYGGGKGKPKNDIEDLNLGRWPANVIHDGSDEVLEAFPDAKGQQGALTGDEPSGPMSHANCYGVMDRRHESTPRIDNTASAARFFYCAKASRKDRNEGCEALDERPLNWSSGTKNPGSFQGEGTKKAARNNHPTVKPTELMRYLCRLVTPPGGVVLDPFMGSGSTGKAAVLEGFDFIGIELDENYVEIARARIGEADIFS